MKNNLTPSDPSSFFNPKDDNAVDNLILSTTDSVNKRDPKNDDMENGIMQDAGRTFIKVVDFPGEFPGETESMWVLRIEGDNDSGVGIVSNNPVACSLVDIGDPVAYARGNARRKPSFVAEGRRVEFAGESHLVGYYLEGVEVTS
tara:strand:- start:1940 stop:2374 length:435 start_codon:yes stop_codon:yes gene_type:complete